MKKVTNRQQQRCCSIISSAGIGQMSRDEEIMMMICAKREGRVSSAKGWISFESPSEPVQLSLPPAGAARLQMQQGVCVRSPLPSKQRHLPPHSHHMLCKTGPSSASFSRIAFMSFLFLSPYLVVFDGVPVAGTSLCNTASCLPVQLSFVDRLTPKPTEGRNHSVRLGNAAKPAGNKNLYYSRDYWSFRHNRNQIID